MTQHTQPPAPAANPSSIDQLWKVIGRYDTYYTLANAKGALLTAFSGTVLGAVVLKFRDVLDTSNGPVLRVIAGLLLTSVAVSSIVSLGYAFFSVEPFLASPKRPNAYHSRIFFEHVAEHADGRTYLNAIASADQAAWLEDMGEQAHALARGLVWKFYRLGISVRWIVFGALIPGLLLVCLLVLPKAWALVEKGVAP